MKRIVIIILFCSWFTADAQINFASLDSLLRYATTKSIALRIGNIKVQQALKAKLAAKLAILDPSINFNFNFTNNTKLPVNVFPADAFGGTPGTFKEVQTGVPYTSNFGQQAEIKLLNLQGWENLRLSRINIDIVNSNNQITVKSLYENIATNYYNVISLQQQMQAAKANNSIADTILAIVQNKYDAGLAKQQDVNEANANTINAKENVRQIQYLINQQYITLKILCNIPDTTSISISENIAQAAQKNEQAIPNLLVVNNSLLKEKLAQSSYQQATKAMLPNVSFAFNNNQQNFSQTFKPLSGSFIPSQSIVFKLNVPIPNATTITNKSNAKYNLLAAQKTVEEEKIKATLNQQQLNNERDKAFSQYKSNNAIFLLKQDTYQKNVNLYKAGLLSAEVLMNSYSAMVNAEYNSIAAQVNIALAQAKILINNQVQ